MRRWIVIGVVSAFILALGAGFAYYTFRQNQMTRVWVPLPLNSEVPEEQRKGLTADLEKKIRDHAIMVKVAQDLNLAEKMDVASAEEAAQEIEKNLFVELGEADSPMGKVPSINIGLDCKNKDFTLMGEVATKIMEHVWNILGIERPKKSEF